MLTVEDGTGLANADAYVSVADADAYFAARSIAAWAAFDTTAKEVAIRAGTQWLDDTYRGLWKGFRTHDVQSLAWPRDNSPGYSLLTIVRYVQPQTLAYLYDYDGFPIFANTIPNSLKRAAFEAAYLAATGFDFVKNGSTAAITDTSRTVDRVSYTNKYASPVTQRSAKLVAIDGILIGLITARPGASFGMTRLIRA